MDSAACILDAFWTDLAISTERTAVSDTAATAEANSLFILASVQIVVLHSCDRPLCARTGRSDLTCHWIRRARFRRRPGRNCIPTRRDKTYPPIAFQPDHACGFYRETQESRYAFAIFKSAVSKPSLKRSYTGCRRLRASAIRPWPCCKRARLVDVRSSQDRASCRRAQSSDCKKCSSAAVAAC